MIFLVPVQARAFIMLDRMNSKTSPMWDGTMESSLAAEEEGTMRQKAALEE